LKIIKRNLEKEKKQEVAEKIEKIKPTLSQEQIAQAQSFVDNFAPKKTELTIKAYAGKNECMKLAKKYKEGKL
jgi:hypothetical protein